MKINYTKNADGRSFCIPEGCPKGLGIPLESIQNPKDEDNDIIYLVIVNIALYIGAGLVLYYV
jgi:hypothetical protein